MRSTDNSEVTGWRFGATRAIAIECRHRAWTDISRTRTRTALNTCNNCADLRSALFLYLRQKASQRVFCHRHRL